MQKIDWSEVLIEVLNKNDSDLVRVFLRKNPECNGIDILICKAQVGRSSLVGIHHQSIPNTTEDSVLERVANIGSLHGTVDAIQRVKNIERYKARHPDPEEVSATIYS